MNTLDQHATLFGVLADHNRLRILALLQKYDGLTGEGILFWLFEEMGIDIEQTTVSFHMRKLCKAGIVDFTTHGHYRRFFICPDARAMATDAIGHYTAAKAGVL